MESKVLIRSEETDAAAEQVGRFLREGIDESLGEAVAFYWERRWFCAAVFDDFDRALSFLAQADDEGGLSAVAIRSDGELLDGDAFKQRLWDTPVYR